MVGGGGLGHYFFLDEITSIGLNINKIFKVQRNLSIKHYVL
jgi:predicted nucleic-acid-binding Zn-ribbon protein